MPLIRLWGNNACLWQTFLLLSTVLSVVPAVSAQRKDRFCAPDPYANPSQDLCNPLRYVASNALTAVSFSLILAVGIVQSFLSWKYKTKYMLAMVIGCYTFAVGLGLRFGLHLRPQDKDIYIVYYLFVVLSPCAFIAADYVLLGRLARHLGAAEHLLVPAHRLTVIFITSDITTFLIQAAGGGMSAGAKDKAQADIAQKIFLVGLTLQLVSFVVFSVIYAVWLYRVYTKDKAIWNKDAGKGWYDDWRTLAAALIISCIGILIRSTFRTAELSEGFQGHLAINEGYFYGLDTLPLFLAVAVYVAIWPGRLVPSLPGDSRKSRKSDKLEEPGQGSVEEGSAATSVELAPVENKPE